MVGRAGQSCEQQRNEGAISHALSDGSVVSFWRHFGTCPAARALSPGPAVWSIG
jgi:hypothetical protein